MPNTDKWATSTDGGPKVDHVTAAAAYDQGWKDLFAGKAITAIYLDEGTGDGWVLYATVDHNR
jgi:hypothetical protein